MKKNEEANLDAGSLVDRWLSGRASTNAAGQLQFTSREPVGLSAKLRQAYDWIAQQSLLPGTLDVQWDARYRFSHNG
jgi:hypothetical protein